MEIDKLLADIGFTWSKAETEEEVLSRISLNEKRKPPANLTNSGGLIKKGVRKMMLGISTFFFYTTTKSECQAPRQIYPEADRFRFFISFISI
jgi:hypothetical protein